MVPREDDLRLLVNKSNALPSPFDVSPRMGRWFLEGVGSVASVQDGRLTSPQFALYLPRTMCPTPHPGRTRQRGTFPPLSTPFIAMSNISFTPRPNPTNRQNSHLCLAATSPTSLLVRGTRGVPRVLTSPKVSWDWPRAPPPRHTLAPTRKATAQPVRIQWLSSRTALPADQLDPQDPLALARELVLIG